MRVPCAILGVLWTLPLIAGCSAADGGGADGAGESDSNAAAGSPSNASGGSADTSGGASGNTGNGGSQLSGGAAGNAGGGGTPAAGGAGASAFGYSCAGSAAGSPALGGTGSGTPPDLVPGVWKNITPAALDLSGTFGTVSAEIDPSNPRTLYLGTDTKGIWRTEDGGSSWARLGNPPPSPDFGTEVDYLDSAIVKVDPCNPEHLYGAQSTRGATLGFWVSWDAGKTWAQPQGFKATAKTRDVGMVVDPTDFNHVLLNSHSAEPQLMETKDGGDTFVLHPPVSSWGGGTFGLFFLYDPRSGQGDSNTWMVNTEGDGGWRTTDAGANWSSVPGVVGLHGGGRAFYSKSGVLYSGGAQYPLRSTDNGLSWEQIKTGLPYSYYFVVQGDGNFLYTSASCACEGAPYDNPYFVSDDADGKTWTPYQEGAQKFGNGPLHMSFDAQNRILYSANWASGVWALKVIDP